MNILQQKNIQDKEKIIPFANIPNLPPKTTVMDIISIYFDSITKTIKFEIIHSQEKCLVSLQPEVGELLRSVRR